MILAVVNSVVGAVTAMSMDPVFSAATQTVPLRLALDIIGVGRCRVRPVLRTLITKLTERLEVTPFILLAT